MENVTNFSDTKLKVFMDSGFTGLHQGTTLISIGLISETGEYFYAECTDYDKNQVDDWIQKHVIDNLLFNDMENDPYIRNPENFIKVEHTHDPATKLRGKNIKMKSITAAVGIELDKWLSDLSILTGKQVQIYSDCLSYDWVLFNNTICKAGEGLNIPDYIYYIPYDLSTALQVKGIDPDINREEFAGEGFISHLKHSDVFGELEDYKHNSLWDACVIGACWQNLKGVSI